MDCAVVPDGMEPLDISRVCSSDTTGKCQQQILINVL